MQKEFSYDYPDIDSLIPRDTVKSNKKKKKKKKQKEHDVTEYDYSDINYNGDIRKLMTQIADSIEEYVDSINSYFIFDGVHKDEWDMMEKKIKKLIKKLRKGDPSVFDIQTLNEVLASEHPIILGYK